MPNIKISDLQPITLPLDGDSTFFEVQAVEAGEDVSRKVSVNNLFGGFGLDASFLTVSANAQLPNERVLTEGTNISFVDTGPNGTLTINATGLTFPLLAPDGTAGAPSYSFASDTDSGMFLFGADDLGLSAGGVLVARLLEVGGNVQFLLPQHNDQVTPTLGFGDGGDGFFSSSDGLLDLSLNGVRHWQWTDGTDSYAGALLNAPALRNVATSNIVPTLMPNRNDLISGIGQNASGQVSLIGHSVEIARATEAVAANQFAIAQSGASTVPELTSLADSDTGFRWPADNTTVWMGGGTRAWNFSTVKFFSQFSDGPALMNRLAQAAVPTVVPDHADDNTGLGATGSDVLTLVAGGVEGVRVAEVAAAITVDIQGALNANGVATFIDDVAFRDGGDVEFFDGGNTVRALLATLTAPNAFRISGAGQLDHLDVRSFNTSMRLRDGIYLEIEEVTASPSSVPGSGFFWVRDDTPNVPMFTDDAAVDFVLNAAAVSPDPLLLSAGGVGAPTYSYSADTDTGMYSPALDSLGFTAGGVEGLRVTEAAGAITVEIPDNLTIDATTGPGPHLSFINSAPGASIIDVLPTGSTNFNFATLRDQTGANFFFIRHDYSLSSLNHRLDFSSNAHNDILRLSSSTQQVAMIQQNYFFDETSFHITATKFLEFDERNTSPVPGVGDGAFWVRDDVPNVPMFTDDAGTDFVLNAGVGPGGELPAGTIGNAALKWDGISAWVEETDARFPGGATGIQAFDAGGTDNVSMGHNGTNGLINTVGSSEVIFGLTSGPTLAWRYEQMVRVPDGSAAVPGITWFGDIATGFFRGALGLSASITGVEQFRISNATTQVFSDDFRLVPNLGADSVIMRVNPPADLNDFVFTLASLVDIHWRGTGLERMVLDEPNIAMLEKAAAPGDVAGYGQFWVRNDVPNTPMFTDDAGTDFVLNGVANDAVQARRTTDYLLTTAFVDITMDVTDVETDATVLDHDLVTNTDNIIIGATGTYEVMVDVTADPDAGAANRRRSLNARVRLNDAGTGIAGSVNHTDFHRDATAPFDNHLSFSFIVSLTATDFITLQLSETLTGGGAGTDNANEISMKAVRLL